MPRPVLPLIVLPITVSMPTPVTWIPPVVAGAAMKFPVIELSVITTLALEAAVIPGVLPDTPPSFNAKRAFASTAMPGVPFSTLKPTAVRKVFAPTTCRVGPAPLPSTMVAPVPAPWIVRRLGGPTATFST